MMVQVRGRFLEDSYHTRPYGEWRYPRDNTGSYGVYRRFGFHELIASSYRNELSTKKPMPGTDIEGLGLLQRNCQIDQQHE